MNVQWTEKIMKIFKFEQEIKPKSLDRNLRFWEHWDDFWTGSYINFGLKIILVTKVIAKISKKALIFVPLCFRIQNASVAA